MNFQLKHLFIITYNVSNKAFRNPIIKFSIEKSSMFFEKKNTFIIFFSIVNYIEC